MVGQTGWWDDKVMTNREARWDCCNAFSKEVVSCIIPKKADQNMMHHHGIPPPYSDSKVLHNSPRADKFSGWEQVGKSHSSLFPLCLAPFLLINFYIHNRQIAESSWVAAHAALSRGVYYFFALFCFKLSPWLKRNSGRLISHMFSFTNSPVQGFLQSNFVT